MRDRRRLLWIALALVVRASAAQLNPCDLNSDGAVNILDVQLLVNQVDGITPCTGDINQSGTCDSVDVNRVVAAALTANGACVVGPGPEVTITGPGALPAGTVGASYGPVAIGAASGTGGYTWSASGLPSGLTFSVDGQISGTPSAGSQSNTPTFTVRDSSGATASYARRLTINPAPTLQMSCSPASGPVELTVAYSASCSASGGTTPYTWSISAGSLPAGLNLASAGATATVSGTPGASGAYSFTVKIADGSSQSATQNFSGTVAPGPAITTSSLTGGVVGVAYSATLSASGGSPAYTNWLVSAGALPQGLTLNSSSGVIAGTPLSAAGSPFNFSVTVKDSVGGTSPPKALSIAILASCTFSATPASVPTIPASGQTVPFNVSASPPGCSGGSWSASVSDPSWMSVSTAGGTTAGTVNAVFAANNTANPRSGTVTIAGQGVAISQVATLHISCNPSSSPVEIGVAYSTSCAAAGGTGPYTWSISGGALPAGFNLAPSGATATVNGTPGGAGATSFTVKVTDSSSQVAMQTFSGNIVPGPSITTSSLANGQVGIAYGMTLAASGGIGCCSWSTQSGGIPGLTLSSSGTLGGTPTTAGTFSLSVRAVDSNNVAAAMTFSQTVLPPSLQMSCNPATGPVEVGFPYTTSCGATGGTTPYTWSISAGSLPAGLSLVPSAATATVSGAPTAAGGLGFTVKVVDSSSQAATQNFSGNIVPGPSVITSDLASGQVGVFYSQALSATGGVGSLVWKLVAGSVPGLTLSGGGTLSGTPTQPGSSYSPTVMVTDSNGISSPSKQLALSVTPAPLVMSCNSANGPVVVQQTYSTVCTVTGGTPPYGWSTSSVLPQGLSLSNTTGSSSGIVGTPQTEGSYSYSVLVKDSVGQTQSVPFTGTIAPVLSISTGSLPAAVVGASYGQALAAAGGVPPYTWSLTGVLPSGLTLASDTGVISGAPGQSGTFNFTVRVTDKANGSATKSLSFTVGSNSLTVSPAQLTFTVQQGGAAPIPQSLSVFAAAKANFTATASGGAWLSVAPGSGQTPGTVNITATPGNLAPNTYTGTITITGTNTSPISVAVSVTLVVTAPPLPQLSVSPPNISVALVVNSGPSSQQFSVINPGNTPVAFIVTGSAPWLTLLTLSGTAAAGGAATPVAFLVTPGGLAAGTYSTVLQVSGGGGPVQVVNVTLLLSGQTQTIQLTQQGLHFTAVAQGPPPVPQNFAVFNAGLGTMNWLASVATISGSTGWLQESPPNGSSTAGSPALPLTVAVDASKLTAGEYFGTVSITASGAANSPQQVNVVLDVLAAGLTPAPLAIPSGAILTGIAGGANPQPRTVSLNNAAAGSLSFASTVSTQDGQNWLQQSPASGLVNPGVPLQMTLTASTTGLSAGVRQGTVRIAFSDNTVQEIAVALVLASPPGSAAQPAEKTQRDAAGSCDPATLILNPQGAVQSNASLTALQPAFIQIQVVDCSTANVDEGDVTVFFDNGDFGSDGLKLKPRGGGIWTESWPPSSRNPIVNITVRAASVKGVTPRAGSIKFLVNVTPNKNTNVAQPTGILNNASYRITQNIAPGSWTSIYGEQLADAQQITGQVPFPVTLENTQVQMGGRNLPLYFVSPTQVNALVPWKLASSTKQQLVVIRNASNPTTAAQSTPVTVSVADAEPGIYAVNNQGTGQGSVLISGSGGVAAPVGSLAGARPVKRGEYIEIYCTGLGPVDQTPGDGQPSPRAEPLARTINTPSVSIGGSNAGVIYSGLAPGLIGLYQINAQVPAGALVGDAVPVFFTIGNATSNTVSIAVQ